MLSTILQKNVQNRRKDPVFTHVSGENEKKNGCFCSSLGNNCEKMGWAIFLAVFSPMCYTVQQVVPIFTGDHSLYHLQGV